MAVSPQSVEVAAAAGLAWSHPLGEADHPTPNSEVSAVTASPLLSSDHLDLLATAALRYRVLTAPPAACLAGSRASVVGVNAAIAGRILHQENVAAALASHRLDPQAVVGYDFRPIEEPLDPVEVVKACHAYEDVCRDRVGWEETVACRLVGSIARAATERIPGYAAAPWRWHRSSRSGASIGYGGAWRPEVPGLEWVDASELARRWVTARVVVITTDVLPDLPAGLPRRPAVIALHNATNIEGLMAMWSDLVTDGMVWPLCAAALQVAVNEPGEMLL